MSTTNFPYQTILLLGATSGIGYAMAERFLAEGRTVILVGRRQARLEQIAQKYSDKCKEGKLFWYTFDITKLDEIASWAAKITASHPTLDTLFLNSGIQRGFNFSKPAGVDLAMLQTELTTNYTAHIHLTHAFLPFLLAKSSEQQKTALIYVTSGLALVPLSRCPNYCASKAALHHFAVALRVHLEGTGVQVLEVMPPAVQTELHDKEFQPDIENGSEIGMPLADFVDETWAGLVQGSEDGEFPIGMAKAWHQAIEPVRRNLMKKLPQAPAAV
ncbi:NAD(P)-binding protein [Morchella conica CCBAS932]|uniref:NAD(P)-binding protein n=1 Tax=Morchella conica CCBAS932 TaxID=1392247 RepID=A0A3N4KHF8_9PEZI|nr:NAD(P)-binding protein [Morchella conica CCBAS932]